MHGHFHVFVVPEHEKELGDRDHDDQGGKTDGYCADGRSPDAACCRVADVGGGVEGDGAGRALRNGHDVREVGHADPVVGFHDIMLY